jgi:hypothetical protein
VISISAIAVVFAGLWLGNLFAWAKLPSPLPFFNKTELVEEVSVEIPAETAEEETLVIE